MKAKQLSVNLVLATLVIAGIAPAIAQEPEPLTVPGTVEGTGIYFEVTDSEYLNVTLESSELVTVMLESVPSMVSAHLEAADDAATTEITLGGLVESTTFYMYEDSYENGAEITTDAAGSYTWTQDLSGPHLVWLQPNPSTKFIRDDATGGDCTSIGTWDSGTKTCTLTTDVNETIEIQTDSVTLDGAGYTVQGAGYGYGIKIKSYGTSVTIKNLNVISFSYGVRSYYCNNCTFTSNTISNARTGIHQVYCDNNILTGNTVTSNTSGISMNSCTNSTLTNNTVSNSSQGITLTRGSNNTVRDNIVLLSSAYGIWLRENVNSLVTGNTASSNLIGLFCMKGNDNTLTSNTFDLNTSQGARIDCDSSIFTDNTISNNLYIGLTVYGDHNQIYQNRFLDNVDRQVHQTPSSIGNVFNLDAPTGGNYWSDWTSPNDDGDDFVDLPYTFHWYGEDLLPWATPDGWSNQAPVADAGENTQILSADRVYTVIYGEATDPDGDDLQYRWLRGEEVLLDWSEVGAAGEAHLDLALQPYMEIGNHTLTLEVIDSDHTATDTMVLTLENSPPEVQPAPSSQVVEVGIDPITIVADVADFDGDTLIHECLKNGEILDSGSVTTIQGGDIVQIPDLVIQPGDPRFPLGTHIIEVRVHDSVNNPVSAFVTVDVIDTTAPSLSPLPSMTMLWPPNHTLRPVTIEANAYDNGGGPISLEVSVSSSEPPDFDGDGNTIPDYYVDSVNDGTGIIELRLRSERSGKGEGRTYTVEITAIDGSGNESQAYVNVRAPHDRRKK